MSEFRSIRQVVLDEADGYPAGKIMLTRPRLSEEAYKILKEHVECEQEFGEDPKLALALKLLLQWYDEDR